MAVPRNYFLVIIILSAFAAIGGCIPVQKNVIMENNFEDICNNNWHGVIPGTTKKEEALTFLEEKSYIRELTIRKFKVWKNVERLDWKQPGVIPARQKGTMVIIDGIVKSIRVPISQRMNLGEFISRCGEPDFIRVSRDGESPFIWIEFIQPQKGLLVVGRIKDTGNDFIIITPEIEIIEAEYFASTTLDGYLRDVRLISDETVLKEIINEFQYWYGIGEKVQVFSY